MEEHVGEQGPDVSALGDAELAAEIVRRAGRERKATADLIRALMEFDRRQLYLSEGFPSLFAYCTQVLHYSEYGAFNRIEVARAASRWPQLLAALEDGSLHLAGARLLAPHLTDENIELALARTRHKSKREIEEVVAHLAQRSLLLPSGSGQYRLHLTISRQARDMLRQLQALLSHRIENPDPGAIFEQAVALLLEKVQRERMGASVRPRPAQPPTSHSRYIPRSIRRAVWARDEGRCAFVGRQGRCPARDHLELHHIVPYAAGGGASVENLELRCRAHNTYEAERFYGPEVIAAARERRLAGAVGSSAVASAARKAAEGAEAFNSPRDKLT